MRKAITFTTAVAVVLAVLVLVLTRRMGWSLGWVYVWLCVVALIINLFCMLRWNPVLIGRRMGFTKGTKSWDLVWLVLWTPVLIAVYAVAITESGFVSLTPDWALLLGLMIFIAGWVLFISCPFVNPFL